MLRMGMGGGIAQLAAHGPADQYLTSNPEITYFKRVWRRYTPFAMEAIEQSWTGDPDFGKKGTVGLSRAGDLVTEVWLQVQLPDLAAVNHIYAAPRTGAEPVVRSARNTAQDALAVEAHTMSAAARYACLFRPRAASPRVASAQIDPSNRLVLAFSPALAAGATLRPWTAAGAAAGAALSVAANGVVAGVAPDAVYAVFVDGAREGSFVQVRDSADAAVSFAVQGADPLADYEAQVHGRTSAAGAASLWQPLLKIKWCDSVGHALIDSVEWEMGGTRIDRHTAEHFDITCELSEPEEKRRGYSAMVGRFEDYDINFDARSNGGPALLFVPLRFSFNKSPSNALPLVALQFHEVHLNFEFRAFADLIRTNVPVGAFATPAPSLTQCQCFATYVFLGQEERARFAQMPHEYLIEQLQVQVENVAAFSSPSAAVNRKISMNLNFPVKEIVWVFQAATRAARDSVAGNAWFDYDIPGRESEEIFEEANIQLNGHDRFAKRPAKHFRLAVPFTSHTRCPAKKVHCYSFAIHPEDLSPSGAANFSRIDSSQLSLKLNANIPAGRLRVHALGYNILRIANGLSGLAFVS